MHIVLNKVARPAHGVENLPMANQKEKNFQYDYHSFSHVNFRKHLIFDFDLQKVV